METIQELLSQHEEAYRLRDPRALASRYTPSACVSSPMFPHANGRDAIESSYAKLFRVFPDWTMAFGEPCIGDGRAMVICKVKGTQQGEFMGLPGTGRKLEFDCVLSFDFKDGLIASERRIYDFTGLLIQLGVLKGKPAM
jgi:steroid delta-isomerase-like uncharacterized protein